MPTLPFLIRFNLKKCLGRRFNMSGRQHHWSKVWFLAVAEDYVGSDWTVVVTAAAQRCGIEDREARRRIKLGVACSLVGARQVWAPMNSSWMSNSKATRP